MFAVLFKKLFSAIAVLTKCDYSKCEYFKCIIQLLMKYLHKIIKKIIVETQINFIVFLQSKLSCTISTYFF